MKQSPVSLEETKNKIIDYILDDLINQKQLLSSEKDLKRRELEAAIHEKELITIYREQGGVTNSLDFNQTAYELYVDLLTTFKFLNDIEKTISKHQEINQSSLNNLNAVIAKAEEQLYAFEQSLTSKKRPVYVIENFNDGNLESSDSALYTERFGEEIEKTNRALVNLSEQKLTLPYRRQNNMIAYSESVSAGTVQLSKQICGVFSYGTSYGKQTEHLIDTSMQTYWSDTLFTDEPIQVAFASQRPINPVDLANHYYGVQHGALFELEFVFESISRINELSLVPYSQFPMDLVAVRYRSSDDPNEPLQEIIVPDQENEQLRGGAIMKPVSFQFAPINCKRLYVICNQIHYVKDSFLVNSLDLFKNDLWFNLNDGKREQSTIQPEYHFQPLYDDRKTLKPELKLIEEMRSKKSTLDLKDLILNANSYMKSMTKYRYQYGFYNIAPCYVEFEPTGVFVSNAIETDGTIKSITLKTEEQQGVVGQKIVTDIEYYVSYGASVGQTWVPILPYGKRIIECERLQILNDRCPLRFKAERLMEVQKEDRLLIEGIDYSLVKEGLLITAIIIPDFDEGSIYTVRYKPSDSYQVLNLIQDQAPIEDDYPEDVPTRQAQLETYSNVGETVGATNRLDNFSATGSSYYRLSEFPYFGPYNGVPTNLKLSDRQNGIILTQDGKQIECVTDVLDPEESYKNFDSKTNRIQYYTHKNVLYFNQPIESKYDIEINYRHFVSSFRVKVILRTNSSEQTWVTPSVSQMRFEIQTAD